MVVYQILTEDVPEYRETVERALRDNGFEDFTISYNALGYGPHQGGKPENSMMVLVAIIGDYTEQVETRMMKVKDYIHKHNGPKGQTAVLLMHYPADGKMHIREECGPRRETVAECRELVRRPRRAKRGRIVAAAGDWKKLLPVNAEVRGKIVRFVPADEGLVGARH